MLPGSVKLWAKSKAEVSTFVWELVGVGAIHGVSADI